MIFEAVAELRKERRRTKSIGGHQRATAESKRGRQRAASLSWIVSLLGWLSDERIIFSECSKSLSRALHLQFLALLALRENIQNFPFTLLQDFLRTPIRTSCSDARVRNIGWPRGDHGHFLQGGGEVYKREPKGTLGGPFCPFDSRWTLLSF